LLLYLDSFALRDVVREVSGVEVAEHRPDGDDQLCALNLFKDVGMADGPNVNLEGEKRVSLPTQRPENDNIHRRI
jgi:hypothetical protein